MIYIDQYHNRYFVRKLSINKNKNIYTNNEIRETERFGTINFRYSLFWFINVSVFVIKLQNSSVSFQIDATAGLPRNNVTTRCETYQKVNFTNTPAQTNIK